MFIIISLSGYFSEGRCRRRTRGGPLKAPSTPRVFTDLFALLTAVNEIPDKYQLCQTEDKGSDTDGIVEGCITTFDGIGMGSTWHSHGADHMHRPKGGIVGDEGDKEVNDAESLAQFSPEGLRIPVVQAGE